MISLQDVVIFSFVVEMMFLGFSLLFLLFRRDTISPRMLFTLIGVILYTSAISIVVSYIFFWNGNIIVGILVLAAVFLVFVLPFRSSGNQVEWRRNPALTIPVVLVLAVYEVSMGFLYGSAFLPHNSSPFVLAVNNLDFSAMMVIDAVFFLMVFRERRKMPEIALFTFALSMALMPNFYIGIGKAAELTSAIVSASVMVVNIVLLYILQLKQKAFNVQILTVGLAASDLIMMAGLAIFSMTDTLAAMSMAMVISMSVYFFLVTHKLSRKVVKAGRSYAFALLLLINGAELAMSLGDTSLGMALSNSIFPPSATVYGSAFAGMNLGMVGSINFSNPLWWLFPFDPGKLGIMAFHKGLSVNLFFAYFWSSFMLIMTTTMSPFYVIMMGSEMSYLVLERYRGSSNPGVRKWALAIIAGIPLFVILVPFYSPLYIFGMSGMLFLVPLAIFLVSVGAIAVSSILFGRRVQCNLVCMSAHMWTNSYYDRFKPGRDRPVLWNIVRWTSFALMILSFGAFVLQSTGVIGMIKIGMVMINPLDFYGMFVLNYIWWFFYFLTPVFGAYSCARQGWCGFGTFAGIFNKFFFRVKAVDVSACESCETRECEGACPTRIPVKIDILKKGHTNRVSCVGCGDCVESCPYGNLGIIDVRNRISGNSESGKYFTR